jgi:excisionase family DNA binding protein
LHDPSPRRKQRRVDPSGGFTIGSGFRTSDFSAHRLAFSVKETAEILGLSEKTIRRLVARRLFRSSRALRHLLIPRKEIERFLDQTTGT